MAVDFNNLGANSTFLDPFLKIVELRRNFENALKLDDEFVLAKDILSQMDYKKNAIDIYFDGLIQVRLEEVARTSLVHPDLNALYKIISIIEFLKREGIDSSYLRLTILAIYCFNGQEWQNGLSELFLKREGQSTDFEQLQERLKAWAAPTNTVFFQPLYNAILAIQQSDSMQKT